MRRLVFLAIALLANAATIPEDTKTEDECNGIEVHGIYHEKEVLKNNLDRPYLLAVDFKKDILYFSYSLQSDEEDSFKTCSINLETNEFAEIDVKNGFSQTVDQKSHSVYIGTSDGVYKYNPKSNEIELFGAKDEDIWTIYFKDNLYFSTFPSQFLYSLSNNVSTRVKDVEDTKVDHFVIDSDNFIYYTNGTGLYGQELGSKDATLLAQNISVRGLTTDSDGKPYACLNDGLYTIKRKESSIEKIADIDDAFGLAFDNDNNIIYSDADEVVRLKPSKKKCGVKKED